MFVKKEEPTGKKRRFGKGILSSLKEVFFITLSILIAFNINVWDRNKKKVKTFHTFIKEVNENLHIDTTVLAIGIRSKDSSIRMMQKVLDTDYGDSMSSHDLLNTFTGIRYAPTFFDDAYSRMKSTDIFDMSQFQMILVSLNIYYGAYKHQIEDLNKTEDKSYDQTLKFWLTQPNIEIDFEDSIRMLQPESQRKKEVLKVFKTDLGRNMAKMTYSRERTTMKHYVFYYDVAASLLTYTDSLIRTYDPKFQSITAKSVSHDEGNK